MRHNRTVREMVEEALWRLAKAHAERTGGPLVEML
jgi:hypothetical protein